MKGKKSNLTHDVLVNYFGKERCNLTDPVIERTLETIQSVLPSWLELIGISFLSDEMKEKYTKLLQKRIEILGFEKTA